jgi:hypothetical protein
MILTYIHIYFVNEVFINVVVVLLLLLQPRPLPRRFFEAAKDHLWARTRTFRVAVIDFLGF